MVGVIETRWLVLAGEGRHVTLGRHRDPEPEEIARAEAGLAANGLAGWLVPMKGAYYDSRKTPELMMVRQLGLPQESWETAVAGLLTNWRVAVRPAGADRRGGSEPPGSDQPP
jgi:hypothetical protein